MINLFNQPASFAEPKVAQADFIRLLNLQQQNVERVIDYYRRANHAVKSNHLLVRVLQSLPAGHEMALSQYRGYIEDYANDLSRHFRFTSPVSVGRSRTPGVLLGSDSEEIWVVTTEDFNTSNLASHWEDASPIRYLRHPKTDLNLMPGMGQSSGVETGPSVILLNLPMLACQYQLWRQREKIRNPEFPRTVMQFLAKYPIPNALKSFQDVAYLNIVMNRYRGLPVSDAQDDHPFYLNNYRDRLVEDIDRTIEAYRSHRFDFSAFLNGMEAINVPRLRDIVALPRMAFTRQLTWALVIARIPIAGMLLQWHINSGKSFDRNEVNEVIREERRLRSQWALNEMVSLELANMVQTELDINIRDVL